MEASINFSPPGERQPVVHAGYSTNYNKTTIAQISPPTSDLTQDHHITLSLVLMEEVYLLVLYMNTWLTNVRMEQWTAIEMSIR